VYCILTTVVVDRHIAKLSVSLTTAGIARVDHIIWDVSMKVVICQHKLKPTSSGMFPQCVLGGTILCARKSMLSEGKWQFFIWKTSGSPTTEDKIESIRIQATTKAENENAMGSAS